MVEFEPAKEADNSTAENEGSSVLNNRGENAFLMEPMRISETSRCREGLADLAVDLAAHSAGFRRSVPEGLVTALADLVRAMNCYYSNLIECHDTHPVDIDRALKEDYSANAEKRNLQLGARAHIAVQKWIDDGGLSGRALTPKGICEVHKRFGELLPEELRCVQDPKTGERMPRITGSCGYTRSWMATGASRA